jgi:hypothetical protein
MSLFGFLPELATAVAAGAALNGAIDAVLGLRAKARAHVLLSKKATTDPVLGRLAVRSTGRPLDETELREAAIAIEQSLDELSKGDRRRVEQGLHQPSRSGEQRYIEELIKVE